MYRPNSKKEETYMPPCRDCLICGICSELCPEVEKMLDNDMQPIIEEMEKLMREEYG